MNSFGSSNDERSIGVERIATTSDVIRGGEEGTRGKDRKRGVRDVMADPTITLTFFGRGRLLHDGCVNIVQQGENMISVRYVFHDGGGGSGSRTRVWCVSRADGCEEQTGTHGGGGRKKIQRQKMHGKRKKSDGRRRQPDTRVRRSVVGRNNCR